MKKTIIMALTSILLLTACNNGVDQSSYDSVVKENEQLTEKILELENQLQDLQEALSKAEQPKLPETVERYFGQSERDVWWFKKNIDLLHTTVKDTAAQFSETPEEMTKNFEYNAVQYQIKLYSAAENNDMNAVESVHDEWLHVIDDAYENIFKEAFERVNNMLKLGEESIYGQS